MHMNYEVLKAINEARMQSVRASAVAAGLTQRDRSRRSPLRLVARMFASNRRREVSPQANRSPDVLFWA